MADAPVVGIIMGSRSDWETMRHAAETLDGARRPPRGRWCPPTARPTCSSSTPGGQSRGLEVIIAAPAGRPTCPA